MRNVLITLLFIAFSTVFAQTAEQREVNEAAQLEALEPPAELLAWLGEHAHPLQSATPTKNDEDLEFLKEMIGEARIVALGEATHGTSEFFTLKHRIVQFLAEEMDFTVFSIEANMPEAYRLNEYVLTGEGDPEELLAGMYFWTWNTQEVLDMILWMREFNASGQGVMQFTGFDMQTPTVAMEEVRAFVEAYDPTYLANLNGAYAIVSSVYEIRGGQDVSKEELELSKGKASEILTHLMSNEVAYSAATPGEIAWAVQNARIVLQEVQSRLFRAGSLPSDFPSRDESMAANVEWILERNPEAKVVLWAHNGHIMEVGRQTGRMGSFLSEKLREDYFSIGFTFYQGDYNARRQLNGAVKANPANSAPAESVGGVFHTLGLPLFVLDLREAEQDKRASWLNGPRDVRMMIGAVAVKDQYAFSRRYLVEEYDAIIFVDQMTPTDLLE